MFSGTPRSYGVLAASAPEPHSPARLNARGACVSDGRLVSLDEHVTIARRAAPDTRERSWQSDWRHFVFVSDNRVAELVPLERQSIRLLLS